MSFGGQHDARLVGNTLTLFDNGSLRGRAPRALRFQLDLVARTATLVNEIENPAVTFSGCCGSARLLPGGHWVVSWGGRSAISEQTETGAPIFELNLGSDVFSYRADPILPGRLDRAALRAGMDAMHPR